MKYPVVFLAACVAASLVASESIGIAAPDFGPNVLLFDPAMPAAEMQARLNAVFAKSEANQFGPERFAFLFKPGHYELDVPVGFYTQVLGLDRSPDEVSITGSVRSPANWMRNHNATCNFWRAVENLAVTPTRDHAKMIWAVSQATALRRVHVRGDINLWDGGWSSGGFLADTKIDGQINSGSQQQWLSRNADWGKWVGGSWNMVFVGVTNPPPGHWPDPPYTFVEQTPIVREKPYLFTDADGRYAVFVPEIARNTSGLTWREGATPGRAVPLEQFYLARPDTDHAATLNAALAAGKNLLFTPGNYHLDAAIRVARAGTIVLGLGYATLIPDRGTPAMIVGDVDGVTVGGLLFEAGPENSDTLLQVGEKIGAAASAADPIFLYDIFARAGGATVGIAKCFLTINRAHVVGDNFWLWRADHGKGAAWDANRNANGLIVNADDVTIYGLFVEHNQEYQTLWNGERGRVYFYQSEIPYDPPSQAAWMNGPTRGFASYKVSDRVTAHEAWGLGVYCVFRKAPVILDNAFETPDAPGVKLHHLVTLRLNPENGSGMAHIVNGRGDPVIAQKTARLDER